MSAKAIVLTVLSNISAFGRSRRPQKIKEE